MLDLNIIPLVLKEGALIKIDVFIKHCRYQHSAGDCTGLAAISEQSGLAAERDWFITGSGAHNLQLIYSDSSEN